MKRIIIDNPIIVEFYQKNKNISIVEMNLAYIKLYENIINSSNNESSIDENDCQNKDINKIIKTINHYNEVNKYEFENLKLNLSNQMLQSNNENMQRIKDIISTNMNETINGANKNLLNDLGEIIKKSLPKENSEYILEIIDKFKYNPEDHSSKIERLVCDISNIKDTQNVLKLDFDSYMSKYNNSSLKGAMSEGKLGKLLVEIFPGDEILNSSKSTAKGDFIVNRSGKIPILFENKNYSNNVNKDEINKFINDVETNKCHGVLLSQRSGISNKDNYHIDMIDDKILVYIHFVDYDPDKIKSAVSIIDIISSKMENFVTENNTIPKDVLINISTEYKNLINTRDKLSLKLKDFYNETLADYDNITMESLAKYLNKYDSSVKKSTYQCDICKIAEFSNLKSLAKHKQHCAKKYANKNTCIPCEE